MRSFLGVELQDAMAIMTWLNENTDNYGHLATSDMAIEVALTNSDGEQATISWSNPEDGFIMEVPDRVSVR